MNDELLLQAIEYLEMLSMRKVDYVAISNSVNREGKNALIIDIEYDDNYEWLESKDGGYWSPKDC